MKAGQAYTCDHCGASVGLYDRQCPRCRKTFDAVRCPRCGHQGPPSAFDSGCPRCQYLAPPPKPRSPALFGPLMAVLLVLLGLAVALTWFLRLG